ncbi:MAG: hypothetical protein ACC647_11870 [Anaerolineales bacterium]
MGSGDRRWDSGCVADFRFRPRWAAQILYSGEAVDAQQAAEIRLVNGSSPDEDIERTVAEVTEQLTALSAVATRVNKKGYLIGMRGWQAAGGRKDGEALPGGANGSRGHPRGAQRFYGET